MKGRFYLTTVHQKDLCEKQCIYKPGDRNPMHWRVYTLSIPIDYYPMFTVVCNAYATLSWFKMALEFKSNAVIRSQGATWNIHNSHLR